MTIKYTEKRLYDLAVQFRAAAIADGWKPERTDYRESMHRNTSLTRDGFVMQITTRRGYNGFKYTSNIRIWGPDGLAIMPTKEYSWEAIVAGLRTCDDCEASDVETSQYKCTVSPGTHYARRVCEKCFSALKAEHERSEWLN